MESSVDSKYICGVCASVFNEPVSLQCGHLFCRSCVERCADAGHQSCPTCREGVDMRHLTEEWPLEEEIKKQSTKCPKCQQEMKLIAYNTHEQRCGGNELSVSAGLRQRSVQRVSVPNRHTFNCPICGQKNLSQEGLLKHVGDDHSKADGNVKVVCPICASMPWGDPNMQSGNFIDHIKLRHKFEYERFVDFSKDDNEQLRMAMERSKSEY